jgi:hypothetical protein
MGKGRGGVVGVSRVTFLGVWNALQGWFVPEIGSLTIGLSVEEQVFISVEPEYETPLLY